MKQEEEQIKELFRQLKQDDERRAPSFAKVWETAVTRDERVARSWPVLRVALAALVLLMLAAGAGFVFLRQTPEVKQAARPSATPEVKAPLAPQSNPRPKIAVTNKQQRKFVRRRRVPAREMPLEPVISQWRSPTDFLLKTPAVRGVKEVPHLGVLRMQIKPLVIEQQNEMEEL